MTDRMQAMVEHLLMIARADAGQLALVRRPVAIAAVLTESWSSFAQRAQDRGLTVRWDGAAGPGEGPGEVETDPDKLRIVLHNLFDNAVCYTDEGGAIRIAATVAAAGSSHTSDTPHSLSIEIANTGSRVRPEDVPHLFERFWRGDASRSETGVHCGLGLALSQRLVSLLGGEIAAESSAGGEFLVRVSLPVSANANLHQHERCG